MVGDIFNKQDIDQLETHRQISKTTEAVEMELDDYQLQRLTELGLYEKPNTHDPLDNLVSYNK
jgi:hypothetical protein